MSRRDFIAIRLSIAVVLFAISGCSSWSYAPLAIPDGLERVQSKKAENVEVSVAILTDEQAKQHFGIDLDRRDLQAIWVRVTNASPFRFWFLRTVLDLDIYPPDEVAILFKSELPKKDFAVFKQRLRDESMRVELQPHSVTQGFVFAPKALGGRYVDVRLGQDIYDVELARRAAQKNSQKDIKAKDLELRFDFAIPLPDGIFDYERLDTQHTYAGQTLPELTLDTLRAELRALPCCSTNADGDSPGDPLNIAIVGDSSQVLNSLSRSGWSFTHRLSVKSISKLIGATLASTPYPVAPVSDLFLFGREQDLALQRGRASIAERNHMRLWLAPFRHAGQQVWVGQISRDIGIKLTSKSSSLTTHIIDPEVDLAREYLLQTLLAGGFVKAMGFVKGSQAAPMSAPAINLVEDSYFSDGLRLVIHLSDSPIPYSEVRSFLWERSAAPVLESQSAGAKGNFKDLDQQ